MQEIPITQTHATQFASNENMRTQFVPPPIANKPFKIIFTQFLQARIPTLLFGNTIHDHTRKVISSRLNLELYNAAQQTVPFYGQTPRAVQLFLVHVSAQSTGSNKQRKCRLGIINAFYSLAYYFNDCVKSVVLWNCNLQTIFELLDVKLGLDGSTTLEDKFFIVTRYIQTDDSCDTGLNKTIQTKWYMLPQLEIASSNTFDLLLNDNHVKSFVKYIHDIIINIIPRNCKRENDPHLFDAFKRLTTRATPESSQDGFADVIHKACSSFCSCVTPSPLIYRNTSYRSDVPFIDVGIVLRVVSSTYIDHIVRKREYVELQKVYRSNDDYDKEGLWQYLRANVLPFTELVRVAARCDKSQIALTQERLLQLITQMKFLSDLEQYEYVDMWDLHLVGHFVVQHDMSKHVSQYALCGLTNTCAVSNTVGLQEAYNCKPVLHVNQIKCYPVKDFSYEQYFIFLDCNPSNIHDTSNTYASSLPIYNSMHTKEIEVIQQLNELNESNESSGFNATRPQPRPLYKEPFQPSRPCIDSILFNLEQMEDYQLQHVLDSIHMQRNPIATHFYSALASYYGQSTKVRDAIRQATMLFEEMSVNKIDMSDVRLAMLMNDRKKRIATEENNRKTNI